MNARTNFLVFMAIIALTTATQGQLSGQAVSEFSAVKTSLQGQLAEGERAQWKLEEAEAALERNQQSASELIMEKALQAEQLEGQQREDFRRFVRQLQENFERRQAKVEQEQAALSELRRVNAMMKEMTERLNITTASDPLETLKICQEMLPKLDVSFRVYTECATNYGDADQRIKVQGWYVVTRQQLLDIFNLAQGDISGISGPATLRKTSPNVESSRTQGAVTATLVPMTKADIDELEQQKIAEEQAKRKLFEKQEAEREADGDFSQAPGLTPEQREAAEIRWSEKHAAASIKGAKPAPH